MTEEVKDWWEETATDFQKAVDQWVGVNYGHGTPSEAELELLGEVEESDIVELGCGGGQCGVALAKRGANVTGIDLSEEQLSFAEKLADEHAVDIDLIHGDVTDLEMIPLESYDIAFNTFVFQWIDDLAACFEEVFRILRSDGKFVFGMPHPFYKVADPETHTVEESYFDTGRHVIVDERKDANLVTYRHTISDIYNALRSAGFDVERLLEPGSSNPDDYEMGTWEEYTPELMSKLPPTLIVKARKECAVE